MSVTNQQIYKEVMTTRKDVADMRVQIAGIEQTTTIIQETVKDHDDILNGKEGHVTKIALLEKGIKDIKDALHKRSVKEWAIISGILFLIIETGVAVFILK
jgi:hypothetical protein